MSDLIPILKWAGGKRQLLSRIIPLVPEDFGTYYEPFVGAGAVLFELKPQKAVINDTNIELINTYKMIMKSPDALVKLLKEYDKEHCKEFYYTIRNADRDEERFAKLSDLEKAARTIYLNRTCYNGLYRVNKLGYFNTPIGRNSTIQIVNEKGIKEISEFLNSIQIKLKNCDYKEALKGIRRNDFVFIDPPYYPTKKDSFLRYDSSYFGAEKQEELKKVCDSLTKKGVKFIETNSDCLEVRQLYSEYRQIEVDVRRCINAKPEGRRGKEIVICNY